MHDSIQTDSDWHARCCWAHIGTRSTGDLAVAITTTTYTEAPFRRPAIQRLMIACPHTGNRVDTGYDQPEITAPAESHVLVDCLECGQDHQWRIEDAVLERY